MSARPVDLDGQRIRDFQAGICLQPRRPSARPQHRFALALDVGQLPKHQFARRSGTVSNWARLEFERRVGDLLSLAIRSLEFRNRLR